MFYSFVYDRFVTLLRKMKQMFRLGISNTQLQHWHEYRYLTSGKSLFVHLPQKLTAWTCTAQTEQGHLKLWFTQCKHFHVSHTQLQANIWCKNIYIYIYISGQFTYTCLLEVLSIRDHAVYTHYRSVPSYGVIYKTCTSQMRST